MLEFMMKDLSRRVSIIYLAERRKNRALKMPLWFASSLRNNDMI